ncbi:MAG: hypothetical protein JRH16_21490 [Deltaproteobacteria bacterium]|nr:hypothetical protein [Deltaproteobacteria bacterium]MBW2363385.1 hypothetical protein [Deltaproteobacteria bacterium]
MKPTRLMLLLATPVLLACAAAHATAEEAARPPASPEEAPPDEAPPDAGALPANPFGFSVNGGPLTINSEELDVDDRDGRRTIVFRKHVEARQGDLLVTCERLEALYPAGSNQPDRLVATIDVSLTQGDQQVWCDEAVFDRGQQKLFCRGNGRFLDGDDEMRGREIEMDLRRETVRVRGDARVVIHDDGPASPAPASGAP